MKNSLLAFGEEVPGFPIRVVNERAVRAAAGILFALAMGSFMNAYLLGNYQPTRLFVIVFLIDMTLRMFSPRLAPSMIVGQWIVRNQTPEWVGAPQKRFAWGLGIALGLSMLWLMVLHQTMGPLNLLICGSCLTLMLFEAAFGICLGCKLYNLFNKDQAQLCPGGVCEVPVRSGWGIGIGQAAVLLVFAGAVWMASRWVDQTGGAMGGFDEMATVEEMGLTASSGASASAEAERCTPPFYAVWLGHEDKWKQHNQCP
jgi:hypothetical protein